MFGVLKGADFVQFFTSGNYVRSGAQGLLYDQPEVYRRQVLLVPESTGLYYPSVYPPHVAVLFSSLARLSYLQALSAWCALSLAFYVLSVKLAVGGEHGGLRRLRTLVLCGALAFPPFWHTIMHGQLSALVLALFAGGGLLLERGRPFYAGVVLGLLATKPQFALVLPVVVVATRQWRMAGGAVVALAAQAALAAAFIGGTVLMDYARMVPDLLASGSRLEPTLIHLHSSRRVFSFLPDSVMAGAYVALAIWMIWKTVVAWRSEAPFRVRYSALVLSSVLVNPHVYVYDLAVLVLPILWLGEWINARPAEWPWFANRYACAVYGVVLFTLLPTAAFIKVQVSVLFVLYLFVLTYRAAAVPPVAPVPAAR
jgi:hypothetical protein